MRRETGQQTQDNFKVAPIISDAKWEEFKTKLASTLLGLAIIGHEDSTARAEDLKTRAKVVSIVMYFLIPALIIIPNSVIRQQQLHALAVLIPAVIAPVLSLIADILTDRPKRLHKYIVTAVYGYLWGAHFFIAGQLGYLHLVSSSTYRAILVLSIISVFTSCSTICTSPVREFSASTFDYEQFNIHSTLYCRFYLQFPVLLTQIAVYYSPMASLWQPAIPGLLLVSSLTFVVWTFSWLSSLYNNIMFVVNNLFNCLVFGEEVIISGSNFRGNQIWWVPLLVFALNVVAIGANVALVRKQIADEEPMSKIVQSQHILLVCLATATSIFTTLAVYLSYRVPQKNHHLIRFNKFDFTQQQGYQQMPGTTETRKRTYNGRCFLGHRQVIMIILTLAVPLIVSLLAAVAFFKFYSAYGDGSEYTRYTTIMPQKMTTWVLLLIDCLSYFLLVAFKQITRVRSKLCGCKLNPCCFKLFYVEVERDLFMKMALKITGALAVMALVLRIQNVDVVANYILQLTPKSPDPNPQVLFFIKYIFFPILIYRSYKRSQTFSHFFHITIFIAFLLTITESVSFFYQSIFVVLALPNFVQNPFRLLLLSPFTVPTKLIHKNQCLYRVGYMVVNMITLFIYVVTLGTFEFTMIFGLPVYWCVIPSISCQTPKQTQDLSKIQVEAESKISMMENTNISMMQGTQNRSTPEHSLYQKIVSQLPFYIFRNKKPGYYLLRISKYILLVQISHQLYGIFEIVSLIGLETQEVTTCHAKEGQTIDRIVDQTWGDNPQNIQDCACNDTLKTVIHEEHFLKGINITSQNQIQLTGIIESAQFFELYKKCLIRSIIFNYNKMLRKHPQCQLTLQQTKQAEILMEDLQGRITKDKVDEFFPSNFISNSNGFVFDARFKQTSQKNGNAKKKLPPLNKKDDKKKKQAIIDDFADLIGGGNTSSYIKSNDFQQSKDKKIDIDRLDEDGIKQHNIVGQSDPKENQTSINSADLHMAVIVSVYLSVLGKLNYLGPQRVYKIMKKDTSVLSQLDFQGGSDIAADSVGSALKIAIGKQLEGSNEIQLSDFVDYETNQFMGVLESNGFAQAISQQRQDIWTVAYNQTKKTLMVKRLAKNRTPLYMFSLENNAVLAVWNNLRFQLLFATNDNDERYSIQTHQYLLRNLLVQACEEPYGYAGYYSQNFLNI